MQFLDFFPNYAFWMCRIATYYNTESNMQRKIYTQAFILLFAHPVFLNIELSKYYTPVTLASIITPPAAMHISPICHQL